MYILAQDDKFNKMIKLIKNSSIIAIDVETSGLNPHTRELCTVQIKVRNDTFLIHYYFINDEQKQILREVLADQSKKWIMHNAKFDLQFLIKEGFTISAKIHDTLIAESVLNQGETKGKLSLASVVNKYCEITLDKSEQVSVWNKRNLSDSQIKYAEMDVEYLEYISEKQLEEAEKYDLCRIMKIENDAVIASALLEWYGIKYDKFKSDIILKDLRERQKVLNANIEINVNSPDKLRKYLNDQGIPVSATNKEELVKFSSNPIIKNILQIKSIDKEIQSIITMQSQLDESGRIHGIYSQNVTSTGRYSCSSPNLQGIPHNNKIRELFIPSEGYKYVIADYSQMELRLMAVISKDKEMLDAYKAGQDLHKVTASIISGKNYEEVSKDERTKAKAMNFGLIYGMSKKGFMNYAMVNYGVSLTSSEADEMIGRFFKKYPNVAHRIRKMKYKGSYTEKSMFGRMRTWSDFPSMNQRANYEVQATGADILKIALARVVKEIVNQYDAKLVLTVHDEIVLEVKDEKTEEVAILLKKIMEDAAVECSDIIPFVADVSIGNSWAEK